MNVSEFGPFSAVVCPECGEEGWVNTGFGPYTIVSRITDGGMSVVYLARDETLEREVALKVLNETYSADERRIAAFEEEARLTASFTHPYVVKVFTTGRALGRFYIAMELVPGGHFEGRIDELGRVPESEVIRLAIQVAEGLEAARAAGLIHRDVKPGNILLDARGNAKIVDFGLARVTKGGMVKAGEIWATPYYVPPETIEGREEDFRSDMYAFGATLYHALAGKPPCAEPSMETRALLEAKRKVLPLKEAAPGVSPEMCRVVDRAMAYEPDDRFHSYTEMIGALGAAAAAGGRADGRGKGWWLAAGTAALVLAGPVFWKMGGKEEVSSLPEPEEVVEEMDAGTPAVGNGEALESISRRYREARTAMETGDYPAAGERFVSLRDDDEVQEPTGSFAAVEAVLACYLEGRPTEGGKEADAALGRLEMAGEMEGMETLRTVLGRSGGLDDIGAEEMDGTAAAVLAAMLAGLKHWERGMLKEGVEHFRRVADAEIAEADRWVDVYQRIAEDYLDDAELLEAPVFVEEPEDETGRVVAVEELDEVMGKLKTKGRAEFNVRARREELEMGRRRDGDR